ncbi:2-dehydro-3-deoxygalactonokinase [Hoeflea sp. TYP-13]|uniref:2-dehydro-3-deoxygalactonokinase n=1 Tax=Hoeflea sp. TYP-13 TaxID=3230023 RepID=UPI0034C6CCD3
MSRIAAAMDVFCVAVDWGTSSFRLWALKDDGGVAVELQNKSGMATLKPQEFRRVLDESRRDLGLSDEIPVIICGMAGSAQGWMEAPYADLPARLTEVPGTAVRIPSDRGDIRILPGLAQRDPSQPDVIRGEETLLLGALVERKIEGTVCLPGTHSKWARIDNGSVTGFSTAMTGEVFALLSQNSTLAHFVRPADSHSYGGAPFSDAVRQAVEAPSDILQALFSVRAAPLLGCARSDEMAARLSGLLIGLEIAGMKNRAGSHVTLISSGILAENYGRALTAAGLSYELCDSEEMVRAGLYFAAKSLWPGRVHAAAEAAVEF